MVMSYGNGVAPIVTVCGPGNLHHLTYQSATNGGTAIGMIPVATNGTTSLLLGFSQNYAGYAFYWNGAVPAFWREGNSTVREPVGTSWANATTADLCWINPQSPDGGVEAQVAAADNIGGRITVFFIPDDLD
ncbi:hypothetical protein C8R45DRAFT_906535 [Mycena sanguinolenta]|nr:hypothetical protein C8R45DRAFT_906535 [Mycena sanguinolenta]